MTKEGWFRRRVVANWPFVLCLLFSELYWLIPGAGGRSPRLQWLAFGLSGASAVGLYFSKEWPTALGVFGLLVAWALYTTVAPTWVLFGAFWTAAVFCIVRVAVGLAPLLGGPPGTDAQNPLRRAIGSASDVLYRASLYKVRAKVLYYLAWCLGLGTIFTATGWLAWASGTLERRPLDFVWAYVFGLAYQVTGVFLTIFLFREIKSARTETAIDLFHVFHRAVIEAEMATKPVILHHLAPFPGLFQILHEAFNPRQSSIEPAGRYAEYLNCLKRATNQGSERLIIAMVQYWKSSENTRVYKGSDLYQFCRGICKNEAWDRRLFYLAQAEVPILLRDGVKVDALGVVRYWYHRLVFRLVSIIDAGVRNGSISLFSRDTGWPDDARQWQKKLGYTFVVTGDEGYLGLPRMADTTIRFESSRVDFQHEAVRRLEELVRLGTAVWTKADPDSWPRGGKSAPGQIEFGEIDAAYESGPVG